MQAALRLVARRTWRFFETFVTDADHMLPPDNFQEDPAPVLARRTSPTNLGLLLLSTACAREFGWLGRIEAVERIEATLATMQVMKKFRGHFFNWYGTADLRPLDPPYVSTVDSGNLAGHLVALAGTCAAWRNETTAMPDIARGVADALDLAREALGALPDDRRSHLVTPRELTQAIEALAAALPVLALPAEGGAVERGHRGRSGAHARQRTRRCARAPSCSTGSKRRNAPSPAIGRDLAPSAEETAHLDRACARSRRRRRRWRRPWISASCSTGHAGCCRSATS